MLCYIFETIGQTRWSLVKVLDPYFLSGNSVRPGVYRVDGGLSYPTNSCLYSLMKAFLLILPNLALPKVDWFWMKGFLKSRFAVLMLEATSIFAWDLTFWENFEEMEAENYWCRSNCAWDLSSIYWEFSVPSITLLALDCEIFPVTLFTLTCN